MQLGRGDASGWSREKSLSAFSPQALEAYVAAFAKPSVVAGSCADYRAGWTMDRADDEADLAAGRKFAGPTLVLWGRAEFPDEAEVLGAWRQLAADVRGHAIDCGHFLPEEAPDATAEALLGFLDSRARKINGPAS